MSKAIEYPVNSGVVQLKDMFSNVTRKLFGKHFSEFTSTVGTLFTSFISLEKITYAIKV